MYSLSSKETTADVVGVFKDFKSTFGDISRLEIITVDCSATLMKAVRKVFPWVNILLCYFHIKQAVMRRVRLS